jgi:hypothetical protein
MVVSLRRLGSIHALMGRRTRATLTLLLLGLAAVPKSGLAQQQLLLTADVSKAEFFEDEPIYLLVRLQNVGTDTARISFFNLFSPAVTVSVRRGHGELVDVIKPVLDFAVPDAWPGQPVPPGATLLKTMVLQEIMGDEADFSRHLFSNHLAPDDYELHVAFRAHWGIRGATRLIVKAAPVVFRIRGRTPAEQSEITALEAIRTLAWDSLRAAGYKARLITWVERRLNEQPDDPFLPFLLSGPLYLAPPRALEEQILAGKVQVFDPDTSEVVSRLRRALIERWKHSTAGALLVQSLFHRHPEQMAVLAEQLRGTPAGEMARTQEVELIQRAQRHRK